MLKLQLFLLLLKKVALDVEKWFWQTRFEAGRIFYQEMVEEERARPKKMMTQRMK